MNRKDNKDFLKDNILTSSEVAKHLEVSRQMVNKYVNEGKIDFFKKTSNGYLFFKPDIDDFKNDKIKIYNRKNSRIKFDKSGVTRESISFFRKNIEWLDEISSMFIYFDHFDAVINGFYTPSKYSGLGELKRLVSAHFIIRDINGKELWLGACNCGYLGEGPRGSITVLKELKEIRQLDFNFDESITEIVEGNSVIELLKNDNNWEYKTSPSFEISTKREFASSVSNVIMDIYLFKGDLVLVQSNFVGWDLKPKALLEKYRKFIPNPDEIIVFNSNEQAKNYGYVSPHARGSMGNGCKMIIMDKFSKRQIWLNPFIEQDEPFNKQSSVMEVIDYCGFDIEDRSLVNRFKEWLDIKVREVPPKPLNLKK